MQLYSTWGHWGGDTRHTPCKKVGYKVQVQIISNDVTKNSGRSFKINCIKIDDVIPAIFTSFRNPKNNIKNAVVHADGNDENRLYHPDTQIDGKSKSFDKI